MQAKVALEDWILTYLPKTSTTRTYRTYYDRPLGSGNWIRSLIHVCMDMQSPGLQRPPQFCLHHFCQFPGFIRHPKEEYTACMAAVEPGLIVRVSLHAATQGIIEFRELNVEKVFGDEIYSFLAHLQEVYDMDFVDVSPTGEAFEA